MQDNLIRLTNILSIKQIRFLYRVMQAELYRRGSEWVTSHLRPKSTEGVRGNWMTDPERLGSMAVVVQGPIISNNDFTLNSVKLYYRLFPQSRIFVSTWENTPLSCIDEFRAAGAEVIINKMPVISGVLNVNYQIESTRSGIIAAVKDGFDYVLKTRSDQRLHALGLETALPAILKAFPSVTGKACGRILVSSNDTRLFIPYHLSDQIQFGFAKDMLFFWSAPIDNRSRNINYNASIRELVNERSIAEIYLTSSYIERMGTLFEFTLESWWNMLERFFCVLDGSIFDCHWPKYHHLIEYRGRNYFQPTTGELVTYMIWLQIFHGVRPKILDTKALLDCGISANIRNLIDWRSNLI